MSAICPTCNSKLSCGCQLTTASNGARICTLCSVKYEQSLKINQTPTSPSNLNVTHIPRK